MDRLWYCYYYCFITIIIVIVCHEYNWVMLCITKYTNAILVMLFLQSAMMRAISTPTSTPDHWARRLLENTAWNGEPFMSTSLKSGLPDSAHLTYQTSTWTITIVELSKYTNWSPHALLGCLHLIKRRTGLLCHTIHILDWRSAAQYNAWKVVCYVPPMTRCMS